MNDGKRLAVSVALLARSDTSAACRLDAIALEDGPQLVFIPTSAECYQPSFDRFGRADIRCLRSASQEKRDLQGRVGGEASNLRV